MRVCVLVVAALLLTCGLGQQPASPPAASTVKGEPSSGTLQAADNHAAMSAAAPVKLNIVKLDPATTPHLYNLLRLTATMYSGSEPDGDEGFAELVRLGVKTIVSVDGARPNIEAAKKFGLRYIHIPFGYNGIPAEAGAALAHVVREAEASGDTLYFHCHHGNHRGPAGAAVACIAAGVADNAAAEKILEAAGTSRDYPGLWRDVAAYTPPPADAKLPELVEVAKVGSLATAMAGVDRAVDNLKLTQAAGWKAPSDHPDLVPDQEALQVKEAFHEVGRTLVAGRDQQFIAWLHEAEARAERLESQLKAGDTAAAKQGMLDLQAACNQCHAKYRN